MGTTDEQLNERGRWLELAHDAVFVCDQRGRVEFWNRGAERLYGWTAEEALARQVQDLPGWGALPFAAALEAVHQKGEWSARIPLRTKRQQDIVTSQRWTAIGGDTRAVARILALSTDVTQEQVAEAELVRLRRLEIMASLAGGLAHDLNNIFAPIIMAVPLLRAGLPPAETQKLLATIESSAQRGAEIVRSVLTLGRSTQGGRVTLQPRHLIKELVKLMRETFPKNVSIGFNVPAGLWPVTGDPAELQQLLLAVCLHARDGLHGGGSLHVSAENEASAEPLAADAAGAGGGHRVRIRVAARGGSVTSEALERALLAARGGAGGGLLPALETASQIARNHGGTLELRVDAAGGNGVVFEVRLPAAVMASVAPAGTVAQPAPRGRGECVLVVDDEASIRESAQAALVVHGYKVLTAVDGVDAVALYARNMDSIRAVVTDLAMPWMDGITLIKAIRRINTDVAVILASGVADEAALRAGLSQLDPADTCVLLERPFTSERLVHVLAEALATEPETFAA
jgi:signal transduction histidine kinase